MRRLSSPGDPRQALPWLWLVVMFLIVCVALNGWSMVTQIEGDDDVIDLFAEPTIVAVPRPNP